MVLMVIEGMDGVSTNHSCGWTQQHREGTVTPGAHEGVHAHTEQAHTRHHAGKKHIIHGLHSVFNKIHFPAVWVLLIIWKVQEMAD